MRSFCKIKVTDIMKEGIDINLKVKGGL